MPALSSSQPQVGGLLPGSALKPSLNLQIVPAGGGSSSHVPSPLDVSTWRRRGHRPPRERGADWHHSWHPAPWTGAVGLTAESRGPNRIKSYNISLTLLRGRAIITLGTW